MNHNDAPPMANYPSPPPPGHNGFYSASSGPPQDQRQPDPEGLQLAAQLGSLAEPLIRQTEAEAQLAAQLDPSQNHQYQGQQAQQYEAQQTQQYEGQQPPQYEGQQGPQLGQQMGHEGMDQGQGQVYGTPDTPGGEPSKKRSKVSRACDECRRKKIRCDAFTEQENCSNCKRVGARCQFSRVPQKRGPSKGYIKELSDRVNNLEASARHSMHPGEVPYAPMEGASPSGYDDFSPGINGPLARKRNHSHISNDFSGSPYQAYRPSGEWQSPSLQRQQPADAGYSAYAPDNMATPQPTLRNAPNGAERISLSAEATSQNGHNQVDRHLDWNSVLERYYVVIHPMLPLLPSTPAKFLARISRANCPATVEDALYEVIQSVNSCLLVEDGPHRVEAATRAAHDNAIKSPFDAPGSRTMATNLLYLQAMLFHIIEADNLGPSYLPQRSMWLGLAVGLASTMKLHIPVQHDNTRELDPDSDEWLGRRVWWCLFILDRWHALSTSSPVMIPDSSSLLQVDKDMLGETTYQLARLSFVQGHLAVFSGLPRELNTNPQSAPVASDILHGQLERCRESLTLDLANHPSMSQTLYLHILYLRILTKRINPLIEQSGEILDAANRLADLLRNTNPVTPFNHHFAAVTAIAFAHLRDIEKIPDNHQQMIWLTEASAGRNVNNQGKDWYSAIMSIISGVSGSSPLLASRPGQDDSSGQGASLHHLADLATAEGDRTENQQSSNSAVAPTVPSAAAEGNADIKEEEPVVAPKVWDQGELMKKGYMCVLASHFLKQ